MVASNEQRDAVVGQRLALNVDRVPLEPFANSFVTNQAGNYKGFLVADAKIRYAELAKDLVNPSPAPRQIAAE